MEHSEPSTDKAEEERSGLSALAQVLATALTLASLLVSDAAMSQTFSCTTSKGKVEYSDRPCPDGAVQKEVTIVDNSADSSALRRESGRMANDRSRDGEAPSSTNIKPQKLPGTASPRGANSAANSEACTKALRSYEVEASSIRKDVAQVRARQLDAQTACSRDVAMNTNHRALEAEQQEQARRAAEEQSRELVKQSFSRAKVLRCDAGGCETTAGRLNGASAADLLGPNGIRCQVTGGNSLICR